MTTRITACRLGEDGAVDDCVAQQHYQPLGRTHELFLARTPTHAFRDRQVVQRIFNDGGQQAGGGLAWNVLGEAQLRAALVDFCQLYAALLGKTKRRLGRIAFGIERGLTGRAVDVDAAVRLLGVQLTDQHGQAARCGVYLLAGVVQASGLQAFFNAGEKRVSQGAQGFWRQFFGAQFNQEILSTHCAASSLANASSRNSGDAIGKPSLARACR
ncbi:hypothetical protein D3C81_1199710 [compost metagenome]